MKNLNRISQEDSFLAETACHLIRKVIAPSYQMPLDKIKTVDWRKLRSFATRQGVSAFVFDAVSELPEGIRPEREALLQWIGSVLMQEANYKRHANAISKLSAFYASHDIKMMLLKGWGLSFNYPHPNHRPTGDMDIWLYGDQAKGDEFLEAEKGIHPIKSSHHTVFTFNGVEVENHITFIETDCHKPDGSEELLLKYATTEPALEVAGINGNKILLPSVNLNAYFLLRHSSAHFATENITLRHLLDWAFFVEKYHNDIDWDALYANAKDKNIHIFLDCQNAICVDKFGFPQKHFPVRANHPELEERIFKDILFPEFRSKAPGMRQNFAKYCYVKTKRHFANKWKYDITYKENFLSILFRFARNRVKSPYTYGDLAKLNTTLK